MGNNNARKRKRRNSNVTFASVFSNKPGGKKQALNIDNKRWKRFYEYFKGQCDSQGKAQTVEWFSVVRSIYKKIDPSKLIKFQHEMYHIQRIAIEEPDNIDFIFPTYLETQLKTILTNRSTILQGKHNQMNQANKSFANNLIKNLESGEGYMRSIINNTVLEDPAEEFENFRKLVSMSSKFDKVPALHPSTEYSILKHVFDILEEHLKRKSFFIRKLINEFFENHIRIRLLKITKLIEEETQHFEKQREDKFAYLKSLAWSTKLEENKKKYISSLLDDIAKFALFLSDLTITFYNFDKLRFNAMSRVNEPLTDLESHLLDVNTLFNFYIKYFFSEKVYNIVFKLYQERFNLDEALFIQNYIRLQNSTPHSLGIPDELVYSSNIDKGRKKFQRFGSMMSNQNIPLGQQNYPGDESFFVDKKLFDMLEGKEKDDGSTSEKQDGNIQGSKNGGSKQGSKNSGSQRSLQLGSIRGSILNQNNVLKDTVNLSPIHEKSKNQGNANELQIDPMPIKKLRKNSSAGILETPNAQNGDTKVLTPSIGKESMNKKKGVKRTVSSSSHKSLIASKMKPQEALNQGVDDDISMINPPLNQPNGAEPFEPFILQSNKGQRNLLNILTDPQENVYSNYLSSAVDIFKMISEVKNPLGKIILIINSLTAALEAINTPSNYPESRSNEFKISIDNLISIMMFIIIKSKVSNILIHSKIIQSYCKYSNDSAIKQIIFILKGAIRSINKIGTGLNVKTQLLQSMGVSEHEIKSKNMGDIVGFLERGLKLNGVKVNRSLLKSYALIDPSFNEVEIEEEIYSPLKKARVL